MTNKHNIEIDSLRAIAVIFVIFYHLKLKIFEFSFFNGGFVGVDIFIVISGYVITNIFFKNNFSYLNFFERRLRRLFPALIFLIFVVSFFAYFYLLPQHFFRFGQSIISNLIFLSNFLFWFQSDYWDYEIFTKPLLHTWTISLEIQFYIFIALIFFLFKKKSFKILFIIFLISFLLLFFKNLFVFKINLKELYLDNYFLIFSRLWEFIFGSLISIYLNSKKKIIYLKKSNYLKNLGLLLIFLSLFLIQSPRDYPNFQTLIPTAGTALILIYNNDNNSNFILQNRILAYLGKMSYSLYLWHFPILIFFLYNFNFDLNNFQNLLILILTFCISFLSYNYVEIPFFKKNILSRKNFFIFLLLSNLILAIIGYLIIKNHLNSHVTSKYNKISKEFPNYNFLKKIKTNDYLKNQFTKSDKIKILICGDSHGKDLTKALQYNSDLNKIYEFEYHFFIKCLKNEPIMKFNSADYIFVSIQIEGKNYHTYSDIKSLKNIISSKYNKQFVIIGATPEFQTDQDLLLNYLSINTLNKNEISKNISNINNFFYKNIRKHIFTVNKNLENLSKELDVLFLNKFDYICEINKKECFAFDKYEKKNFYDYSHYTNSGILFFGEKIFETGWLKLN